MKRTLVCAALLALGTTALTAQVYVDDFNRANNANVGNGWVEDRGQWNLVSNQAEAEQIFLWQYCTQPTIPSIQDACVECTVSYNTASAQVLQFGGVALRMNGPATDTNLIMVKVQDNNSSGDFDSVWLYERPGGATASTSGWTPATKMRVRLLAIDGDVMALADSTGDGKFDITLRRQVVLAPATGPVGIDGFGGAFIDDFAFFDGVIMPLAANPTPTPGAKIDYKLRGFPGANYQVATALQGNGGIPIPNGTSVPLALDSVFSASIGGTLPGVFQNYSGTMDGNGDATCALQLPPIPQLTGITLYTAFINLSTTSFLNVSNEDQLTIQ